MLVKEYQDRGYGEGNGWDGASRIGWYTKAVSKLWQFAMSKACENWFLLVNCCVYHVRQTCEIDQILPYSVNFKAPGNFEIRWVRQYLINDFIWNKGPVNKKMTVKIRSPFNLYVGPVNISLIFDTARGYLACDKQLLCRKHSCSKERF